MIILHQIRLVWNNKRFVCVCDQEQCKRDFLACVQHIFAHIHRILSGVYHMHVIVVIRVSPPTTNKLSTPLFAKITLMNIFIRGIRFCRQRLSTHIAGRRCLFQRRAEVDRELALIHTYTYV